MDFSQFEGKVVLVVNVASQCGYTDGHYRFAFGEMMTALITIQCQSLDTVEHFILYPVNFCSNVDNFDNQPMSIIVLCWDI